MTDAAARPTSGPAESIDELPCGVVAFDDDGRVLRANATLGQWLGLAPDALEGRHVESLLTVAGRIFYQTHFFPLLRLHGEAREIFLLFRTADGGELGALVNGVRRNRDGRPVSTCALIEVRERRKYEEELLRARREAEAANRELAARSQELELANSRLEEQAVELELQQQHVQEQAEELEAQHEELQAINEHLSERGEELERARAEADAANQAKSQFLATMSHELRTPLNAIGGYVQLVELGVYGGVSDGQRDVLARISRAQRHLLRLVNDVLNLARIEAGRVEYAVEAVPLGDLVGAVVPMVEPQLAAAGLALDCRVASGLVARADRDKAQQVLINLLTNAVKFTEPGGRIVIDAAEDAAASRVRVTVRDTGVGIAPDKLAAVFEPFVQVEVERTKRKEGTGLGLAISRDLARGMGGDLTAESTVGEGSAFTLLLPRA